MTSPNRSHFSPLKRIICSCSIGAKSVALVLILMPGSSVSGVEVLQARRLLHDVLAGQIVAAHLQHLGQGLRRAIAIDHRAVGRSASG